MTKACNYHIVISTEYKKYKKNFTLPPPMIVSLTKALHVITIIFPTCYIVLNVVSDTV